MCLPKYRWPEHGFKALSVKEGCWKWLYAFSSRTHKGNLLFFMSIVLYYSQGRLYTISPVPSRCSVVKLQIRRCDAMRTWLWPNKHASSSVWSMSPKAELLLFWPVVTEVWHLCDRTLRKMCLFMVHTIDFLVLLMINIGVPRNTP